MFFDLHDQYLGYPKPADNKKSGQHPTNANSRRYVAWNVMTMTAPTARYPSSPGRCFRSISISCRAAIHLNSY
jgi:hypothetical protein